MKKFLSAILILTCLFFASSCNSGVNLSEYVSQVRIACFKGENNNFSVTAYSEMREYPLKSDGYVGEMSNYIILKITPTSDENMLINDLSADFLLDKQYSVPLAYRAEAESYVANIKVSDLPVSGFTVTVSYGGQSENIVLSKVGGNAITTDKALSVAASYKKKLIDELVGDNKYFEIMIRVMIESDTLYYYVGIVETEYTTALLISSDGKVLAEKRLKNQ